MDNARIKIFFKRLSPMGCMVFNTTTLTPNLISFIFFFKKLLSFVYVDKGDISAVCHPIKAPSLKVSRGMNLKIINWYGLYLK